MDIYTWGRYKRSYKYKSYGSREYEFESCTKKKQQLGIGGLSGILLDNGKIVHIACSIAINDDFSLLKFINAFYRLLAPPKPNIINRFQFIHISQLPFQNSPSLLKTNAWVEFLSSYPGSI